MTTSDLVARLTARANLTYNYPIEDILLLRGAANEIDRLNAENVRLREALEQIAGGGLFQHAHEFARAALTEQEKK